MNEVKSSQEQLTWKVVKHQDKYFCVITYDKRYVCMQCSSNEEDAKNMLNWLNPTDVAFFKQHCVQFHPRNHYTFKKLKQGNWYKITNRPAV